MCLPSDDAIFTETLKRLTLKLRKK